MMEFTARILSGICLAALCGFRFQPAFAAENNIQLCDYDQFGAPIRINFEERNFSAKRIVDGVYQAQGAKFGERFSARPAMVLDSWYIAGGYDSLGPFASAPLQVYPGIAGQDLILVPTNESAMLAGVGPGPNKIPGAGSIAIEFDESQVAFGFKVLSLTGRHRGGMIRMHVFDVAGQHLTYFYITGASRIGLCSKNGLPEIGGVTIANEVPGGIGLDDVKFGHSAIVS